MLGLLIVISAFLSACFWAMSTYIKPSYDYGEMGDKSFEDFLQEIDSDYDLDGSNGEHYTLQVYGGNFLKFLLRSLLDIKMLLLCRWLCKTKNTAPFYYYIRDRLNRNAAIWACIAAFLVGVEKLLLLLGSQ